MWISRSSSTMPRSPPSARPCSISALSSFGTRISIFRARRPSHRASGHCSCTPTSPDRSPIRPSSTSSASRATRRSSARTALRYTAGCRTAHGLAAVRCRGARLRRRHAVRHQYLAYEALSPGMKTMLSGMRALHSDRRVAGPARDLAAANATKLKDDAEWRETAHLHPVVRTHPETRRKALYVNRQSTIHLENMTEEESRRCSSISASMLIGPSSRAVFAGARVRSRSGTIAALSTARSTMQCRRGG